jgi:hypothetical protein
MGVDLLNIAGLKELEHAGPIVMVNLMRFHDRSLDGDGSGWDAYLRYSALTVPMIKARGGTLLWTGKPRRSRSDRRTAINGTIWRWCTIRRWPRSST